MSRKPKIPDSLSGMVFRVEDFHDHYDAYQPTSAWDGMRKPPVQKAFDAVNAVIDRLAAQGKTYRTVEENGRFHPWDDGIDDVRPHRYVGADDLFAGLAAYDREMFENAEALSKDSRKAGCVRQIDVIIRALEHCRNYAPSLETGKLVSVTDFQLDSHPPLLDRETGARREAPARKTPAPKKFDT